MAPDEWAVEVLYVQPNLRPGCRGLDFATLADLVVVRGDPLSLAFAEHLRRWTQRAGAVAPG